ncbi:hypothetical protein IscW_ISCW018688, partial [Ixodes scapularis]
ITQIVYLFLLPSCKITHRGWRLFALARTSTGALKTQLRQLQMISIAAYKTNRWIDQKNRKLGDTEAIDTAAHSQTLFTAPLYVVPWHHRYTLGQTLAATLHTTPFHTPYLRVTSV